MLDERRALGAAIDRYVAAATAAGMRWSGGSGGPPPPGLVERIFDVGRVAEQLTWLRERPWHPQRVLPNGGWVLPWPTDAGEALDDLSFSVGTPFPWRRQLPLFHFERIVFTFVLAGEREGEIWRYDLDPDTWGSVRAATSLAALFTEWARGVETGAVYHRDPDNWLFVDEGVPLRDRGLDPFAFPVPSWADPLLRERQRACGVDLDRVERGPDCQFELLDEIADVRTSLGG